MCRCRAPRSPRWSNRPCTVCAREKTGFGRFFVPVDCWHAPHALHAGCGHDRKDARSRPDSIGSMSCCPPGRAVRVSICPEGVRGGGPLVRRCRATATRLAAMSRTHWRLAHPDKGLRCFGQLCSCRLNRAERPECRRQSVPTKAESWRVAGRVPVRGRAGLLSQLAFGQGVELEPSRLVPQPGVGIGDTAAGRWKGGC